MESIGSWFFLIVLLIGVLLLVRKKKVIALTLISISLLFLYVIPFLSYKMFKSKSQGTYVFENKKIVIDNEEYKILEKENVIASGDVQYSNSDASPVFFIESDYHSDGENITDGTNIFYKK